MKVLCKMLLLTSCLLVASFGCKRKDAEPACVQGVIIERQGCPNAVLIQVLNKPGVGQSVKIGNPDNTFTAYENVVKTTYTFSEDFAAIKGRTLYFHYTLLDRYTLNELEKPAPCQAIYINYDVPYINLQTYSWAGCPSD